MTKKKIELSSIMFWIAIIILLILFAWKIFGSSPTTNQLALGLTFFAVILTWQAIDRTETRFDEQTSILREIRDAIKERKK
ncbi:hypothetical protein GF374_02965 [Candidatus Woesearchaeota archaeon]|nr:hypothetical protein [Candidatus Woesearchaeota archaeon]